MKKPTENRGDSLYVSEYLPRQMRLPGFILEEEIELGDAIRRTTAYSGIKPCGAWGRRVAKLNQWIVLIHGCQKGSLIPDCRVC